ncbi:MAG: hypothetical protein IJE60_02530 [Tyzzerella sp.]|nr:hypothetical protein [Tyzzerella sp.]
MKKLSLKGACIMYEIPVMEIIDFSEDIRTNVIQGSNINPGDNNVGVTDPWA